VVVVVVVVVLLLLLLFARLLSIEAHVYPCNAFYSFLTARFCCAGVLLPKAVYAEIQLGLLTSL
jgi:hypothetical protein